MLVYDLEGRGEVPLYEYLYRCIREDILRGKLKAGERLPSKREMAESHKVAVITVENAYAQLLIEGYLTAKERSGYFVNPGVWMSGEGERGERGEREKSRRGGGRGGESRRGEERGKEGRGGEGKGGEGRGGEGKREGRGGVEEKGREEREERKEGKGQRGDGKQEERREGQRWLADFSVNRVARDAFPFSTWAKLMRRVLADREESFLEKPPAGGVRELREAVAEYLKKAKGLEVDPGQIILGPGTEYLHHLILLMIGQNRMVAVEDPGYKKVGQLYEGSGLKCLYIPVDRGGMVIEKLEGSNATLVHISPSHHFPTGCVMPADRRHRLLRWAREHHAYIIEDDYDSEFRFDGRPIPTLASLDNSESPLYVAASGERGEEERGGCVIYMNTFTKTLAPSIRIAYMVLPRAMVSLFETRLPYISGAISSFEQYTLAAFLREGYYERHISRMKNAYRQHRARLLRVLEESELSELAQVEEHCAGLHLILHVKKEIDEEEFVRELAAQGVRIEPLSRYCYRTAERYRQRFLMHYCEISEEDLREAFARMEAAAKRCGRQRQK